MNDFFNSKKRPILFALVFLVIGFILSFSYRTYENNLKQERLALTFSEAEEAYREDLIVHQERNRELSLEIGRKQEEIQSYERAFILEEETYADLVEEAKNLRLLLGVVPAEGEGVRVILSDAEYDPAVQNPNDYIVHESHVFKVINELKISGAQGIAINGQRITENSYIKCTGPVITIDGDTFPAPFIIEAIGDMNVLHESLHLRGGIVDRLLLDNIDVTTEQVKKLQLAALVKERSM